LKPLNECCACGEDFASLAAFDARSSPARTRQHRKAEVANEGNVGSDCLLPAVVLGSGRRQRRPVLLAEPAAERAERGQAQERVLLLAAEQSEGITDQRRQFQRDSLVIRWLTWQRLTGRLPLSTL